MTAHTPGPWSSRGNLVTALDGKRAVAVIRGRGNRQETIANSALIAAAPQLLAACQCAVALLTDPDAAPEAADDVTATLRAALAAARGK